MGTASDRESAIRGAVKKKVNKIKFTPRVLALLRDEQRNNSFVNIVIDRRGQRVPKLVCCSDDVILTLDTGGGNVECHIREYRDYFTVADDLAGCGAQWPQIDRGGIYKDGIQKLNADLDIVMDFLRKTI